MVIFIFSVPVKQNAKQPYASPLLVPKPFVIFFLSNIDSAIQPLANEMLANWCKQRLANHWCRWASLPVVSLPLPRGSPDRGWETHRAEPSDLNCPTNQASAVWVGSAETGELSRHTSNKCFLLYATVILFVKLYNKAIGDWSTPLLSSTLLKGRHWS